MVTLPSTFIRLVYVVNETHTIFGLYVVSMLKEIAASKDSFDSVRFSTQYFKDSNVISTNNLFSQIILSSYFWRRNANLFLSLSTNCKRILFIQIDCYYHFYRNSKHKKAAQDSPQLCCILNLGNPLRNLKHASVIYYFNAVSLRCIMLIKMSTFYSSFSCNRISYC